VASVLIKHPVEDFEKWKAGFDAFHDTRKSGGEKSYQIFRTIDDPNNVVALFEWDDIDNARAFLNSSELKDAMEQAGVSGQPEITIMYIADHGSP
jgi:quinol monooxygenase YgiN